MKKARKFTQFSVQAKFNGHTTNSSSLYFRLDSPGVFFVCVQYLMSFGKENLTLGWPGLRFKSKVGAWHSFCYIGQRFSGASRILAHFQWRATTNTDSCELLSAHLVHSEKQVRANVMPFNREWGMPQNMQDPPVNKDGPSLEFKERQPLGMMLHNPPRCEHVSVEVNLTFCIQRGACSCWGQLWWENVT